jgi:hypothetical protein
VGSHAGVALRGVSRDDVARARRRVVLNVRRSACVFRGENPRDGAKRSGRGRRGGRSRRTLFLQQGGVFGAGRHHRACSICADEGGGGGSAARTKRRSHDRKRNTRQTHPRAVARVDPVVPRSRHRRAANDETRDVPEETFETMRSRGDAACGVLSGVRRQRLARGFFDRQISKTRVSVTKKCDPD